MNIVVELKAEDLKKKLNIKDGAPGPQGVPGPEGPPGKEGSTRVGWGAHPLVIQENGVIKDKVARVLNFTGAGVTRAADGTVTVGATWDYYAINWSTAPSVNSAISGGTVYTYVLNGTTRYRFVPTSYDPTTDAFYSTFSGGVLSGLITTRG